MTRGVAHHQTYTQRENGGSRELVLNDMNRLFKKLETGCVALDSRH